MTITGIDVHAYLTRDAARSIAFYRDVLGLKLALEYGDGRGAEFTLPDGSTFGIWDVKDEMPFAPAGGVFFAVDDFERAVAEARERGAKVTHVEETPVCFMAVAEDPDGNGFILHHRK